MNNCPFVKEAKRMKMTNHKLKRNRLNSLKFNKRITALFCCLCCPFCLSPFIVSHCTLLRLLYTSVFIDQVL